MKRNKVKPIICGNWKLNLRLNEAQELLHKLAVELGHVKRADIIVAPVAPFLQEASRALSKTEIQVAAQNVFYQDNGAFTGEWSTRQLADVGCTYAIAGHSERRQIFGEDSNLVAKKVAAILKGGLIPIACVGESTEERQNQQTASILKEQLQPILEAIDLESNSQKMILAYEPIWAIGTGRVATPEIVEEVHATIRTILADKFGMDFALTTRIIYGGSVNSKNASDLMRLSEVDGLLVGGASLKSETFVPLVKSVLSLDAQSKNRIQV